MLKQLKGNVLSSCVTPAYIYSLETMALREKQQEKVQVGNNNWIRRIVGVKRADKRRMDKLRVEVGWKEWEMKNWQREQMLRKWRGNGGEEDRNCDGRTALRRIWKEWVGNGEQ